MSSAYTKEELVLIEEIESEVYQQVADLESEKKRYSTYAAEALKKDARINIRMNSRDLEFLQKTALKEGIPYQTFISSLLHKYAQGMLVEEKAPMYDSSKHTVLK